MSKPAKRSAKPATTRDALDDELRQRDRRIAELRAELSEAEQLISELRQQVEDCDALIEQWKEAFGMVQDDSGWRYAPWLKEHESYHDMYCNVVRDWNRFVPEYNAAVNPRPVGRPLAASDAQVAQVMKLRKRGVSLRGIVEETGLGLGTVRTIIDGDAGRDRATMKRLERIDPDRKLEASWRARKRTRDALPARLNATLGKGRDLIQQAKGLLGRAK
jgi:hypothetical protein